MVTVQEVIFQLGLGAKGISGLQVNKAAGQLRSRPEKAVVISRAQLVQHLQGPVFLPAGGQNFAPDQLGLPPGLSSTETRLENLERFRDRLCSDQLPADARQLLDNLESPPGIGQGLDRSFGIAEIVLIIAPVQIYLYQQPVKRIRSNAG